jgi:hypothetical protein
MLTSQSAFDWPTGSGPGGTASGVALLAWPRLFKSDELGGGGTTLAVSNLVSKPGFTDFVIMLYDQNGLLDFVTEKLDEGQTEYVNLGTWGFVNPGWLGSAIVSACFWEHEVTSERGESERNLVGLAGLAFDSPTDRGGATSDLASGAVAFPLTTAVGPEYGPAPFPWGSPCRRELPGPPPTPEPSATTLSPTVTPTVTPTATPLVAPPYAPGSPEVNLPILGQLRTDGECSATLRVQNVGREETTALVVLWGQAGQCPPDCAGPSGIVCSGPIEPGSTWELTPPTSVDPARSATVFSLTDRLLSAIGATITPGTADRPVAEYMCDRLAAQVVGSCDGYVAYKQAYDAGASYAGVPMGRAWGAPLTVQVFRQCRQSVGVGLGNASSYEGASGPELGYAAPGESFSYGLPRVTTLGEGRSSVVHIQNAGDTCATVEFATHYTSPASSRCESRVMCAVPAIAPGESVSVDVAGCRAPGFEGAGLVRSNAPLAITVDDAQPGALSSYSAKATGLYDMHGQPILAEHAGVTFAPLLFKNYQGWTSRLFVQGLGPGQTALKVTLLDRSGDAVSSGWFGPLCEFDGAAIDLETMPGVPYSWVGSARCESYAGLPADATPFVPAPTSTAEATVGPSPTRTPCTGTCPPTATAAPTRKPVPTLLQPTPGVGEGAWLYVPLCAREGD